MDTSKSSKPGASSVSATRAFANMHVGISSKANRRFSEKFTGLYAMGSTAHGLQQLRHISKRDLKDILIKDFRIELELLCSSQRIAIYRKLRRVLMSYEEYGKTSVLSLWKFVLLELVQLAGSDDLQNARRSQRSASPTGSVASAISMIGEESAIVQIDLSDDDDDVVVGAVASMPPPEGTKVVRKSGNLTTLSKTESVVANTNQSTKFANENNSNPATSTKSTEQAVCKITTHHKPASANDINYPSLLNKPTILSANKFCKSAPEIEKAISPSKNHQSSSARNNRKSTTSVVPENSIRDNLNHRPKTPMNTAEKIKPHPKTPMNTAEKIKPHPKTPMNTSEKINQHSKSPIHIAEKIKQIQKTPKNSAEETKQRTKTPINSMEKITQRPKTPINSAEKINQQNVKNNVKNKSSEPNKSISGKVVCSLNISGNPSAPPRPSPSKETPNMGNNNNARAHPNDDHDANTKLNLQKKKNNVFQSTETLSTVDAGKPKDAHNLIPATPKESKKATNQAPANLTESDATDNKDKFTYIKIDSSIAIQLSCAPDQLKFLQMDLMSRNRIRFEFNPNPNPIEQPDRQPIALKHILNWPGIVFHLNLGKVRLSRSLLPNYKRSLIIGGHSLRDIPQPARRLELRRVKTPNSTNAGPELSIKMLDTFFAMVQSVDFAEFGKNTKFSMKNLFKSLQCDMRPMKTVLLNQKYSYFLNANQYARYYLNSAECRVPTRRSLASDELMVRLLETIHPEIHFQITECPFVQGGGGEEVWAQDLFEYFDRLHTKRCPDALAEFNEMLRNAFAFECTICQVQFNDGDNAIRDVSQHIRKEHILSPNWNCAECDLMDSTFKLAENMWAHHCA